MDIYTIGHSTHSQEEFIEILKAYDIELLVDVRSYPGSKHVPHFNKENMEMWMPDKSIEYIHMRELGGRRKAIKDIDESLVDGWNKQAFRNYASYSLTDEYEEAIDSLISLAEKKTVAYMCAESLPWRCHRLIISNNLLAKGIDVHHIMSKTKTILHELGKFGAEAIVEGSKVIYPSKG